MFTAIQNFVKTILPSKRKTSPSGWISFNAPCCIHNSETVDTRGRGGITFTTEGAVSYHCFNCGYTAFYQPGWHLNFKFRRLLKWFSVDDNEIRRLVIEALRIKDLVNPDIVPIEKEEINFAVRTLPDDAVSFTKMKTFLSLQNENYVVPPAIANKVNYVGKRKINLNKYDFFLSEKTEHSLHQRVIIPFYWQGKCIGYTARSVVDDIKPKYFSNYDSGFVFNIDNQRPKSKFVIVCEGPFDAMSIDGVAVLGSNCSEQQADIIDSLAREVIVVADKDSAGTKLLDAAIEYGWSASFPVWQETCKDINEAVVRYGKLFVLKSILDSKETSKLKIKLLRKKFNA